MNRKTILQLLQVAEDEGVEAATALLDEAMEAEAQAREAAREGEIDALKALDEDPTGQDREHLYIAGCGEYDTVDYRGRPLKPRINDAGEPWWM